MHLTIQGETPAKKNSRITLRNGMTIPSKRYQEWHRKAVTEIKGQIPTPSPYNKAIKICMTFTHGDLRRRDSDNGCSSVLDLLTDAGIIQDDNWQIVQEIAIFNRFEKNFPKVEIEIVELQ